MNPKTRYLVLALLVALVCGSGAGGCDKHSRSKTFHCKDGTVVTGPGSEASDCNNYGGLG
jgi:hypothetical protein